MKDLDARVASARDARLAVLERLLPAVVHRLNNSLAVIRGTSEIGHEADAEQREAARDCCNDAGRLLTRLGAFAKRAEPDQASFDLREIIDECVTLLRPLAEACRVELEHFAPSAVAVVRGDRLRLSQLLVCLVGERLIDLERRPDDSSLARRHLRLSLRRGRHGWVVGVVYRTEPGSWRELESSPLLAEAVEQAETHHAQLSLRTLRGATALRMVLPALQPEDPGQLTLVPARSRAKRVLLFYDDAGHGSVIRQVLESRGYDVLAVGGEGPWPAQLPFGSRDVVLYDADLELRAPGLVEAIEARLGSGATAILLGDLAPGSSVARRSLPKPFRSSALFECLQTA